MASPFRVFRKYQKTLLVVAGVILMFVFVIGDALVGYLGGSRSMGGPSGQGSGDVAVSWDNGRLTNAELDNLVMRRQITNAFLENVEALGEQSAREAGVEPRSLRVQRLRNAGTRREGVEQSVVFTKFFGDAAREAGMHVSDAMVVQYLDELGRGNVSRADMRDIVEAMQKSGWNVSTDYVIDAVRDEMLARNYLMSSAYSFQTITPQQRWTDWLRVNDRVVVEAAAIPVESFASKVPTPTPAEQVEFFDKYKNLESAPELLGEMELPSARPGFRIPRKLDVQFIRANFDEYLTKVEAEITDEEIAKYYEENKEQFIQADTQFIDDENQTDETDTSDDPQTDEATSDADTTEPVDPPEESNDSNATGEANDAVPPEGAAEPGASDSTPPAPDGNETPASEDEEPAPGEGDQSSRSGAEGHGVFRLAAFLQEQDAAEKDDGSESPATPADDSAAETPPPSSSNEEATGDAASSPSTEAPAAAAEGSDPPADPAEATTAAPAAEKPKEYQPLEEVTDVIRRELAQRRVVEQQSKLMNDLMVELNADFQKYLAQVLNTGEEAAHPKPPASLANLAPLAEKHGLGYEKTGPMPWLDFRNTAVGKSGIPESGMRLSSVLFLGKEIELYEPVLTVDVDNNRYIAMKTADTPARVPKLADVRDDVVRVFKLRKAAELALKDAEEQAKKVQEAGATLADYFADRPSIQVVRTDPFSQLTRGDVPDQFGRPRFRLSQPDGIVAAGPEFLREVFELKDKEVGAVLNHDQSIAYVIRIVEHQDSPQERRNAYLAEAHLWDGVQLMNEEHARAGQQLLAADLGAGLDWKRPHDQVEREEE